MTPAALAVVVTAAVVQVRKALDLLKKLAGDAVKAAERLRKEDGDETPSASDDDDDEDEEAEPFDREALEATVEKYDNFWAEFGRALKLGAPPVAPLLHLSSAPHVLGRRHVACLSQHRGQPESALLSSSLWFEFS